MHEDDFEDEEFVSKTQIKLEMQELKALGLELCELPVHIFDALDMSDTLRHAIEEYRRIGHKNAKKRQAGYIGKLMRKEDSEHIKAQLHEWKEEQHRATRQHHLVEQWRDRLIDNPDALSEYLEHNPQSDRQQLRTLLRAIEKERRENKPPAHARKLFKFLQSELARR
jgi:ribosome-associated protein